MFNATVDLHKPQIVHMTSTSGPSSGGDIVVFTGQHLAVLAGVRFGGVPAAVLKADNNQVIAVAPPHPPGTVEVAIETAGGNSTASLADLYTYLPAAPPHPRQDAAPRPLQAADPRDRRRGQALAAGAPRRSARP